MIPFEKMVGAGNDFVFIQHEELPDVESRGAFAKEICDRNHGVGADGLVVIHKTGGDQKSFVWDFYNSDGSHAEMCGNAARCAVLYIKNNFGFETCEFKTMTGPVWGRLHKGLAEVSWKIASDKMAEVSVDLENFKTFRGYYLNTGVPHFVLLDQLKEISAEDCAEIQTHPKFGEANTNVTLLDTSDDGVHLTKTFERGVKGFTLACGTGVIASAFVLQKQNKEDVYNLKAPGGDLSVKIDGTDVTLIGPAELIFKGQYLTKGEQNV